MTKVATILAFCRLFIVRTALYFNKDISSSGLLQTVRWVSGNSDFFLPLRRLFVALQLMFSARRNDLSTGNLSH